jgi:hypothetical protein
MSFERVLNWLELVALIVRRVFGVVLMALGDSDQHRCFLESGSCVR